MNKATKYACIDSPVGELLLLGDDEAISEVMFNADGALDARKQGVAEDREAFAAAEQQIAEYFDGARTEFELPLAPAGTEFQLAVWAALRDIPYGETRSYAEIAAAVGKPQAARAVGGANNKNPIAVVVPCHRVVGSGGALVGYAGGLDRKTWLLAHEAERSANSNS